jgi:hypothetical protein
MNIPNIILGMVMITVGVLITITQIKRFRRGEKDHAGYISRLLISCIGSSVVGIIVIVKAFTG